MHGNVSHPDTIHPGLQIQRQFLAVRKRLRKTAIFVTHDVREALMLATRIGLMRAGRLEMLATPQEFVQERSAEARAFLACLDWRLENDMESDAHRPAQ